MKNKLIYTGIILGVLLGGLGLFYPKIEFPNLAGAGNSTAGTNNSTRKVAQQSVTSGTTTAFSMLNTDSTDRTIMGAEVQLANGAATSTNYTISCATSTSPSSLSSNTNYILNPVLVSNAAVFGTTTGAGTYFASSSPGLTGTTTASTLTPVNPYVRTWASGSYLNCLVTTSDNYNAFNSSLTGSIAFPYLSN